MKLIWSKDKTSVVLIAETEYEIAFAELFLDGMNYARYSETRKGKQIVGARYTVLPEEVKQ